MAAPREKKTSARPWKDEIFKRDGKIALAGLAGPELIGGMAWPSDDAHPWWGSKTKAVGSAELW